MLKPGEMQVINISIGIVVSDVDGSNFPELPKIFNENLYLRVTAVRSDRLYEEQDL